MPNRIELRGTRRLQEISHGFKQAGILIGAIELGIFTAVSEGAHNVPHIAEITGLSKWAAQKIVDACAALDLLERKDGLYYNAPDVQKYLVKTDPNYRGIWMLLGKHSFGMWADVAAILKGDKDPGSKGFYTHAWADNEIASMMNMATYNIGLGSGYRLARTVDFSSYSYLLDLAGGSGAYCIALTSEYPNLKATVMDYPTICISAKEFIAKAGLSDRINTHPGDIVKDDFPKGADLMLMSSCLPNFETNEFKKVLSKAYESMEPGGTFIILGETLYNDRIGPLESANWGIEEALVGGHGETFTESEVCSFMEQAGFIRTEVAEFSPGVLTRITAHKQK